MGIVMIPIFIYFMIMISPILKKSILKRYFDLLIKDVIHKGDVYNFRCAICNDSKKNKNKKRGYLLYWKDRWIYKCHNCGVKLNAEKWLKEYHPVHYREYIKDILSNTSTESQNSSSVAVCRKSSVNPQSDEKNATASFKSILKGDTDIFDKAKQFCSDRLINPDIWNKWYVSTKGVYGGRIIIPFLDNNNKIYFYQARTLYKQEPKYLNRVGDKQIYNIYNVDKTQPIQVCEGPIDSLFLDNSIAILGCSISNNTFNTIKGLGNIYWLFDFDKAGLESSREYITKGEYVFLWKKFKEDFRLPDRDKFDVNEVVLYLKKSVGYKFTFDELKKYYSNSVYDKIWL